MLMLLVKCELYAKLCEWILRKWTSNSNGMHGMEKPKRASSRYNEAITTKVKTMERQDKAALTDIGILIIYMLVHFLRSYGLQKQEISTCSNRCEVGVWYVITNPFQSYSILEEFKLTSYMLAYLIWCANIECKTTIFNPGFLCFFIIFWFRTCILLKLISY